MSYNTVYLCRLRKDITTAKLIKRLCLIVGCIMDKISTEEFYKRIGKNVAKCRKEKGLSQMDLSLQMGYKSISIISSAEIYYKGKHFNLEHILKISQIFDIEVCKLLEQDTK